MIHQRAGPKLQQACTKLAPCAPGKVKITKAYNLQTKAVIHTVDPQDKQPTVLRQCYRNALKMMALNTFRTIAFPSIVTGAYGYPLEEASLLAVTETISWLSEGSNKETVDLIVFCTHTRTMCAIRKPSQPWQLPTQHNSQVECQGLPDSCSN